MDLSIITVTWNSADHITEQMRSTAAACQGLSCEQIIIDNASEDKTVELVKSFAPRVTLISNNKNLGFVAANNQGYKVARGEFLLFLNPDTRLTGTGSLKKWLAWMGDHPDIGISGCKLNNPDGSFNLMAKPRRFPTLFDQLMIIFKIPHLFPVVLDKYLYKNFNYDIAQPVDSVRGSCLLVRKSLLDKLGFAFDPRYYMWFEDVDLCREAKRLGLAVWYTPAAEATDLVGRSFKRRNFWWKQQQYLRSMFIYFKKWGPRA